MIIVARQCSPYQEVSGKINYHLKQHFLLPEYEEAVKLML